MLQSELDQISQDNFTGRKRVLTWKSVCTVRFLLDFECSNCKEQGLEGANSSIPQTAANSVGIRKRARCEECRGVSPWRSEKCQKRLKIWRCRRIVLKVADHTPKCFEKMIVNLRGSRMHNTYTIPAAIIPGFTDRDAALNSSVDLKVLCSP